MLLQRAPRISGWLLGPLVFAAAFWALDLAVLRAGVPHPLDDTWEDAIAARLLLEGEWFRSHVLFPPLWPLRDERLTIPVLVHGPLLPALMAIPVRVLGSAAIDGMAWAAAGFALLTLIPLFRVAARHFGEPIGGAAALLFTLSPLTIAAVNHYASVVLGALLVATTLDLLARERPRAAWAGVAAGLGYLVRPELIVALPALAWLARGPGPDRRGPLTFTLVFLACAAPWWAHHLGAVGTPFFNLTSYLLVSFWPPHPGDGLVRDFAATPDRFAALLAEAWPELWRKWAHFLPRAIRRALLTPSETVGWLAPIGALVALGARPARRFAIVALALVLVPVVAMTLLVPIWLYPVPMLPLHALAAALGARWLVERLPRWAHRPRVWIALLVMASVPPAAIRLGLEERDARHTERWLAADRLALAAARRTPENALRPMFSDTPDFVAWTTGRPTLWVTRAELERLYSGTRPLPAGLPAAIDPADTWFHAHDPRNPAGQRGERIGLPGAPHSGSESGAPTPPG